jgi:hypothetical protein
MALKGAPSKSNHVHRVPAVRDWLEIEDVPFSGDRPDLPSSRSIIVKSKDEADEVEFLPLNTLTEQWWEAVSTMPHCKLWGPSDWAFAIGTALVADAVFYGDMKSAGELRQREAKMWTTEDARRANKVRYVEPRPTAVAPVTEIDEYRDSL